MGKNTDISIKQATEEILRTAIFKNISRRTNELFAQKLAAWLIRYVLIISSMNESLKINLEEILANLHGEQLKKIVEITNKTFQPECSDKEKSDHYIW